MRRIVLPTQERVRKWHDQGRVYLVDAKGLPTSEEDVYSGYGLFTAVQGAGMQAHTSVISDFLARSLSTSRLERGVPTAVFISDLKHAGLRWGMILAGLRWGMILAGLRWGMILARLNRQAEAEGLLDEFEEGEGDRT